MELQHVNVKFLVSDPQSVDLEPLIPVFHRWIQGQVCEELLLDIADYRHVPAGPGIVLIGHQADYSLDNTNNRLGVRYNRKASFDGTNLDRLGQAACSALKACQRLEAEAALQGKIRFNGRDIDLFINDRMLAPNGEETRQRFDPELKAFFDTLFRGSDYSLTYDTDPRHLLGVSVRASQPFAVIDLIHNLVT
jgi:hypothetical protein